MKHLLLAAGLLGLGAQAQVIPGVRVVGNWSNCRMEFDQHIIMSNSCRTILFRPDSTGEIRVESRLIEVFTWQQTGAKLRLLAKTTDKPFLTSGVYSLNQRTEPQRKPALVLTDSKGVRYILL